MKRENSKLKGLNRLLILVLAAAITMTFSFSSVLAETEFSRRPGQGNSDSAQSYPVYIYGRFTDSSGNPVATITKANGDVTPTINSSGWVTLGKLLDSGMTEAPDRARYTESNPYTGDCKATVLSNLDNLTVYSGNNFTKDEITAASDWALVSADGANEYVNSGTPTWHLNGQYKVWRLTYDANGGSGTMTDTSGYMNNASAKIHANKFSRPGYEFIGWSTSANGKMITSSTITMTADTTLYAQWKEKNYTVTYTDGVDGEEVFKDQTTKDLKYGDAIPGFEGGTPTRAGYDFAGWSPNVSEKITGEETNIVYTAVWAPKNYTVTYTDGVDGEEVFKDQTTKDLKYGDAIPGFEGGTPTRAGYNFAGWNPSVSEKITGEKTNIVYTAKWTPKSYTVTYTDGVDGEEIFRDQKTENLNYGKTTPVFKGDTPTRAGYDFAGWSPNVSTTITGDKTDIVYTAQWTLKDNVNITYNGNGGKTESVDATFTNSVTPEIPFKVALNTFIREDYVFAGWNTQADGKGTSYTAGTDTITVTDGTTVLFAQWKDDKNNNGISDDQESYTVTYTDGVPDEEVFADQVTNNILTGTKTPAFDGTPTRSGYTFAGWSPEVADTVTKNVTYTAVWTKNNTPTNPTTPVTPTPSEEHKVVISPNNGDPDITQTVPDGGKAVEPDDLTNDGYKFDGWYTDSEMTQPFDFSQPIKSDVHIYAKWTKTNTPVKPGTSSSKKVSGILLPKVIAKGKHTQTLTWTALKNVDGYFIYTNHCDEAKTKHAFKKVADYKASKARVYTKKNLKTYHNYKYYVAAYKIKNGKKVIVRNSVTVHSVCGNTSARSTNVKAVKASKHSVTLKKGKTYKIKATITKVNKTRAFLDATHCALLRYLSADSKIATVNYSTGTIKAKKAGKTTVYVLGVNGVRDKVTVTVK